MSFVLSAVKNIAETATTATSIVWHKISTLCSTIASGIAYIRWLFEEGSRLQLLESCQGEALTGTFSDENGLAFMCVYCSLW